MTAMLSERGRAMAELAGLFQCSSCTRVMSIGKHLAKQAYGPQSICKTCAADVYDMTEQKDGSWE